MVFDYNCAYEGDWNWRRNEYYISIDSDNKI